MTGYGTAIILNGSIVKSSKNLRALRDYARVSPVKRVECTPQGEVNGALRVIYQNGAESKAFFSSYHIMIDFVRNRRSWRNADIVIYGDDIGYLTKPGIIAGGY
jgi:hypothetical protein